MISLFRSLSLLLPITAAFVPVLACRSGEAPAAKAEKAELKFVVAPASAEKAKQLCSQPATGAERRDIYFLETSPKSLTPTGLILRVRNGEKEGKAKGDLTVKFRADGEIDKNLSEKFPEQKKEKGSSVKRERDMVIGGSDSESLSITEPLDQALWAEASKPKGNLQALFSPKQKELIQEKCGSKWPELNLLGPVKSIEWDCAVEGLEDAVEGDDEVSVEQWTLESGREFLELSIRVPVERRKAVAEKFSAFLKQKGVELDPAPESKTSAAIDALMGAGKK